MCSGGILILETSTWVVKRDGNGIQVCFVCLKANKSKVTSRRRGSHSQLVTESQAGPTASLGTLGMIFQHGG